MLIRFIKKGSKAFLIIAAFVAALVLCIYLLLNHYYLPRNGKKLIASQLEELLDRKVHIEKLRWNIRRGLVAQNVTIGSKSGDGELLKAQSVTLKYSLKSLFQKKFIVKSIIMQTPRLFLRRNRDGSWNIADIFKKLSDTPARIRCDNYSHDLPFRSYKCYYQLAL